mmetsp:Transcript_15813/g.23202  ORF Transcript_15813/g.23202 Transcript_15813/m.23202 type:complete len:333 (-) Transcript_15813:300-1298(-)
MARSGGKQFVMVFEQFFKRLVVQVDKLFQRQKVLSQLLGLFLQNTQFRQHGAHTCARLLLTLVLCFFTPCLAFVTAHREPRAHALNLGVGDARHNLHLFVDQAEPIHLLERLALEADFGRGTVGCIRCIRHTKRCNARVRYAASLRNPRKIFEHFVEFLIICKHLPPLRLFVDLFFEVLFEVDVVLVLDIRHFVGLVIFFFLLLILFLLILLVLSHRFKGIVCLVSDLFGKRECQRERVTDLRCAFTLHIRDCCILTPERGAFFKKRLELVAEFEKRVLLLERIEEFGLELGLKVLHDFVVLLQRLANALKVEPAVVIKATQFLSMIPRAFY